MDKIPREPHWNSIPFHSNPLECPKCPKTFKFKSQLIAHLFTHDLDAKVKCKICGNTSKNPFTLSRHMRRLHATGERPSCDICYRVFFNSTSLRRHTAVIHSTRERPRLPCGFPGCEKTFLDKVKLSRHVKTEHAENPVRFRCTLCGKEFKLRIELESHIPTHTTEKPFMCATCGRSFALRRTMKSHEMTHLEKSTRDISKCPICPHTYLSRNALSQHIRRVHENLRNFQCTFCDKRFNRSSDLKGHVEAKHATNKDLIHFCDKCEYKSHLKVYLARHMRRCHIGKRHECYFCRKQFTRFQGLVKHFNRFHTLEK